MDRLTAPSASGSVAEAGHGADGSPPAPKRTASQILAAAASTRLEQLLSGSFARTQATWNFIGEVVLALGRLVSGRAHWRGRDLLRELDKAGPASLPVVALVSGLVGLILAYMGAAQLQRLGAQAYIADLVTVGAVREVAALMTGVILAGRIGAAHAAELGSMQANEEIDAIRVMGVRPAELLVLPRLLAMLLMAPLMTALAAAVAVAAGAMVATLVYGVPPLQYATKSLEALKLAHVGVGLFKGTVYGLLVALAGCRQGLSAGRSAQAVGDATTTAVVQAIVWIVVAASLLTIAFQRLGW